MPELRIVEDALWQRVKERQNDIGFTVARDAGGNALNRAHRRKFLLSGLLVCGCCGAGAEPLLCCRSARSPRNQLVSSVSYSGVRPSPGPVAGGSAAGSGGSGRSLEKREVLLFTNEHAAMKAVVGQYEEARVLCEKGLRLAGRSRARAGPGGSSVSRAGCSRLGR